MGCLCNSLFHVYNLSVQDGLYSELQLAASLGRVVYDIIRPYYSICSSDLRSAVLVYLPSPMFPLSPMMTSTLPNSVFIKLNVLLKPTLISNVIRAARLAENLRVVE
jgi:hypothetical protein